MRSINTFLFAICISLAIALAAVWKSPYPPQTPRVYSEQQPYGTLKGEKDAESGTEKAAPTDHEHGGKQAQQADNEGTEFWPPFLGLRLKITDSLIAAFTFGLLVFTGLLWRSTDKLWLAGEKQIAVAAKSADAAAISAQTSKVAIRAVISIRNFKGVWIAPNNGAITSYAFFANIENVGNSHASCQLFVARRINAPDVNDFIFSTPPNAIRPTCVIGPKAAINPAEMAITIDDAVRVWHREIVVLYYCRVDYRDIFDETHHAECCVRIGFRDDPRLKYTDEDFIVYAPWGPQNTVS